MILVKSQQSSPSKFSLAKSIRERGESQTLPMHCHNLLFPIICMYIFVQGGRPVPPRDRQTNHSDWFFFFF